MWVLIMCFSDKNVLFIFATIYVKQGVNTELLRYGFFEHNYLKINLRYCTWFSKLNFEQNTKTYIYVIIAFHL